MELKECNLKEFVIFLMNKNFINHLDDKLFNCLLYYINRKDEFLNYIKDNNIENETIFFNLLLLFPLSAPIIQSYMKSDTEKLKILSLFLDILKKYKELIDIETIFNETLKYEEELQQIQQKQREIQDKLNKLETLLEVYKKRKEELKEIKKEIEESKRELILLDDRAFI